MSHYEAERPRRPSLLRRLMWLLILVLIGVVGYGWIIRPAPPIAGASLNSGTGVVEDAPRRTVRVAAFNIASARGADKKVNIERTARLLGSFDVIALNEVRGNLLAPSEQQALRLGGLLKAPWLFAPAERRFWHDAFGNGLICRVPVEQYAVFPLPTVQWSSFRNLVHARVMLDGVPVNFLITHIDRDIDRTNQLRIVAQLFLSLQPPAVLMGDLNTSATDPVLADLISTAGVEDPIGDTEKLPAKERIDWILTRGLTTLEAGALPNAASDHPLVWANLSLPAGPVEQPRLPTPVRLDSPASRPSTSPATTPASGSPGL